MRGCAALQDAIRERSEMSHLRPQGLTLRPLEVERSRVRREHLGPLSPNRTLASRQSDFARRIRRWLHRNGETLSTPI